MPAAVQAVLFGLLMGAIYALPFLPCIWLALGRMSNPRRVIVGSGMICAIPGILAIYNPNAGTFVAIHLVSATCVIFGWRYFVYSRPKFSLASLFLATIV